LAPTQNTTLALPDNRGFLNRNRRRSLTFSNTSTGSDAEEDESYGRQNEAFSHDIGPF
jgi:hypothetical protein